MDYFGGSIRVGILDPDSFKTSRIQIVREDTLDYIFMNIWVHVSCIITAHGNFMINVTEIDFTFTIV